MKVVLSTTNLTINPKHFEISINVLQHLNTILIMARTSGHSMDLHPTVISLQGFYTRRDPKTTRPDFTPLTSEPGSAPVYSLVF